MMNTMNAKMKNKFVNIKREQIVLTEYIQKA